MRLRTSDCAILWTCLVASAWGNVAPQAARADELRLDAAALFRRAVVRDVQLAQDGRSIELESGRLYEDDGPAAGYSYKPNEERLSDMVQACKELEVESAACFSAILLVGSRDPLRLTVNGRPVNVGSTGKTGGYWQTYPLPLDALRNGTNRFCLSGPGKLWIARADEFPAGSVERTSPPGRSLKSDDGGQTWDRNKLGPAGDLAGEYYVRLYLDQFRATGTLVLPVMDVGNLADRSLAPPLEKPGGLRLDLTAEPGASGRVRLRVRSGRSAASDDASWTAWQEIASGERIDTLAGRYFQVAIDLTTDDPRATPRVTGLRIETQPVATDDWTRDYRVTEVQRPAIVRSSIPFAYESCDHPRLRELRERYHLDDVVRGATSEFETITRLAAWSATRWQKGHLGEAYPAWNALDILRPHADGKPTGGFCQQFNLVFLQACESLGIPGRCVSIGTGDFDIGIRGGHEVVELWSNDYRKWVYVDGNMAWYATDPASDVPLSLWELRQRQLPLVKKQTPAEIRVVHLNQDGQRWTGLMSWPGFLELRLIPRSNFLEQAAPLPLNQGMRGWFWTGHHVWTDDAAPASKLYGNRVSDRRNWEWTLNDLRVTLEATSTPGEIVAHVESTMPSLDRFEASLDGGPLGAVQTGFRWNLHAGKNQLAVNARNNQGRTGSPSRFTIERRPRD